MMPLFSSLIAFPRHLWRRTGVRRMKAVLMNGKVFPDRRLANRFVAKRPAAMAFTVELR